MGILLPLFTKPPRRTMSDRCKCAHAMFMHLGRCTVPGCKCQQFRFPTK